MLRNAAEALLCPTNVEVSCSVPLGAPQDTHPGKPGFASKVPRHGQSRRTDPPATDAAESSASRAAADDTEGIIESQDGLG